MQTNYNQESFKKGEEFEKYVEEVIFPEAHYELLHKTSDSKQNIRRYSRKSMEPDFQFKCRVSGKEFYIEAKWRAKPYKDKYEVLSASQFESFPKLHSKSTPVFIVFGYGGNAFNPDYISLIPLKDITAPKISPAKVHSYNIDKTYFPNSKFTNNDFKSEENEDNFAPLNSKIQKTHRPNSKIFGLAAVGIIAIFISIYSFALSEPENATPEEKLQDLVENYYQSMNSNQIEKLPEFLSSNVESWYGTKDMSLNQIIKDAKNHRGTYPYSSTDIDWDSFKVMKQSDGTYMASYDMIYKRKKDIDDDYKIFNLHMITTWDKNLKMKSIREIRN